jgi:hypothetical protein
MKLSVQEALETTALTFISAVFFAGFFQLNGWLFSNLIYREGVNWVFLPAGFRVILVLLLGVPGAVGIMLGTWYIDRGSLIDSNMWLIMLNGVVSGFIPYGVLKILSKGRRTEQLLQVMNTQHLLNFTLIFAAASSVAHQLVWLLLKKTDSNILVDVWPMFIGDTLGTFLILFCCKLVISRLPLKQG